MSWLVFITERESRHVKAPFDTRKVAACLPELLQRVRNTETQRVRNTGTQRVRNKGTQRVQNTETQRVQNTGEERKGCAA